MNYELKQKISKEYASLIKAGIKRNDRITFLSIKYEMTKTQITEAVSPRSDEAASPGRQRRKFSRFYELLAPELPANIKEIDAEYKKHEKRCYYGGMEMICHE